VTNHPDETNSLRERVDEAISWFTGTDEPAPVEPGTETPDETTAPETGPVAGPEGTEPALSEPAPVAADVTEQPAAEATYGDEQPAADAERIVSAEPVAAEPSSEPVAEPWSEPVVDAAPVATGMWHGADAAMPPESLPKRALAPEAEAVPVEEPVMDEPVFDEEPVAETSVESSDIDEPTRIHPIDASLGAPIVDESAADDDVLPTEPVAEAPALHEPMEDDYTEPLAADAAADAEAARQRSLFRDATPTLAMAGGVAALGAVPPAQATAVLDAQESARLRREERAARDRQLGKVIASQDDDEPLVTPFTAPSTYKGLPSFGFFLFRLVIAAVVGIRAWQHVTHLSATRSMWEATVLQSPGTIAWVQIGLEIAIAVMLVLGLGTRIAGVLLLVLSMAQLLFVQWGAVNPFQPGSTDFIGVVDVLLAGAGLLLATIGGGRAAIDGVIHTNYVKRKNSKLFA
jgi:uncharacterized membrane protein YphA (DoxX/SURF4 family)